MLNSSGDLDRFSVVSDDLAGLDLTSSSGFDLTVDTHLIVADGEFRGAAGVAKPAGLKQVLQFDILFTIKFEFHRGLV